MRAETLSHPSLAQQGLTMLRRANLKKATKQMVSQYIKVASPVTSSRLFQGREGAIPTRPGTALRKEKLNSENFSRTVHSLVQNRLWIVIVVPVIMNDGWWHIKGNQLVRSCLPLPCDVCFLCLTDVKHVISLRIHAVSLLTLIDTFTTFNLTLTHHERSLSSDPYLGSSDTRLASRLSIC